MESRNNNNYIRKFKKIGRYLRNTRQPDVGFLQSWGESLTSVFFFFADRFLERKDTKEYKFGTIKAFEKGKVFTSG